MSCRSQDGVTVCRAPRAGTWSYLTAHTMPSLTTSPHAPTHSTSPVISLTALPISLFAFLRTLLVHQKIAKLWSLSHTWPSEWLLRHVHHPSFHDAAKRQPSPQYQSTFGEIQWEGPFVSLPCPQQESHCKPGQIRSAPSRECWRHA